MELSDDFPDRRTPRKALSGPETAKRPCSAVLTLGWRAVLCLLKIQGRALFSCFRLWWCS